MLRLADWAGGSDAAAPMPKSRASARAALAFVSFIRLSGDGIRPPLGPLINWPVLSSVCCACRKSAIVQQYTAKAARSAPIGSSSDVSRQTSCACVLSQSGGGSGCIGTILPALHRLVSDLGRSGLFLHGAHKK